jgi:hypothetical protein
MGCLQPDPNSMPTSSSTISTLSIASLDEITPSVRLTPTAKSSRSYGVAIITAYDAVLKVKADRRLFGNGAFAADFAIVAPNGSADANNRTSQVSAP